jgi:acetolactate synthase-1/3 small subunit
LGLSWDCFDGRGRQPVQEGGPLLQEKHSIGERRGQQTKQLHKLINVIRIRDLEPGEAVQRELAMFKINADGAQRTELLQISEIFRARVVDVSRRTVILEVTGTNEKIEAFEDMIRPFGLVEMSRTGEIAMSRGRTET